MIGQQINLYHERFRPQRLWGSFKQFGFLMLILIVTVSVASFWYSSALEEQQSRNKIAQDRQTTLTARIVDLNEQIDAELAKSDLDEQIALTAEDLAAHERALGYIKNDRQNYGQGFSPFLTAIARVNEPEIWLDEIYYSYDFISLKGSSLNEESVPAYFASFGSESVLAGRQFDVFEVSRSEDWKVDFQIATRAGTQ